MKKTITKGVFLLALSLTLLWSCQDKKYVEDIYVLSETEIRFLNQDNLNDLKTGDYDDKQAFIQKVTTDLEVQNKEKHFIKKFVKKYGYPDWEMARWFQSNGETVAQIPVFFDNGTETQAVILAVEHNNKLKFRLFVRDHFEKYAKNKKPKPTTEIIKGLFIIFDFHKFGESSYLPEGYFVVTMETTYFKSTSGYFYDDCYYVATYYGGELIRVYEDCVTYYVWGEEMVPDEEGGGDTNDWYDGGGSVDDPTQTPLDPCDKILSLISNTLFIDKMNSLKDNTNNNYEKAYMISVNTIGASTYNVFDGNLNEHFVNLPQIPMNGFIHNHFDGGESTFSVDDIKAIYDFYNNGLIQDLETFYIGVTTAQGTSYTLHFSDIAKFEEFGLSNLNNDVNFQDFTNYYYNNFSMNTLVYRFDEIVARELAMLKALENSGLILTKGNSDFTDWKIIEDEISRIINIECN